MDIAKDLALIDLLCARDFPAEHSGTDGAPAGPGYHSAWLGPGDWPDASDCYAYEAAVVERLTQRWGASSRWGTVTLGERIAGGEDIPKPWPMLSALASDLRTWEVPGSSRLVTVAVADRDDENQPQLWVVVTDTDPP
ncbi:hypothetical protein [Streptomyces fulvoviolaceus]|uniref:hypothetical protein n=1 Tax=Streptomyces fulvoviolaceus TaxID=285535 RepID=UPI0004C9319F|nr:hypothetical protein [Streptomyces fulvoviolaceus]MCT9076066.1 hypothetical protein [Streptomyces fulvoviolaceus]